MMLNKIYDTIEEEKVSIIVEEFTGLPRDMSKYTIAYIGKHRVIKPNSDNLNLHSDDMQIHLLIECRLFNEDEEIYIFPRQGKVYQRNIKSGDEVHRYIKKSIQLRNDKNQDKNESLEAKHYIDTDMNGYSILRYVKIIK